jgi:hypothetical protein
MAAKRGPKSIAGKKAVSQNARKHGLTGKILLLSDEEKGEFGDLREYLFQELDPVGTLEQIAVEDIAISYWRYRQALEWERTLFRRVAGTRDALEAPSIPKKRELKELHDLLHSVHWPRSMDKEVEASLRDHFGEEFVNNLLAWEPENPLTLAYMRDMAAKSEMYHLDPPPGVQKELKAAEQESRRKADDAAAVSLKSQFRQKLFQVAGDYLVRLEELAERQRVLEQSGTGIDSATRYISSIRKALYQAMSVYQALKASRQ